ncbi:hypothetical protein Achl_4296 (plasmid) [Pseudarthrobacter chlorophenolicus A6]|uniref:Uncharacterized protein n=1 Tax=Pseudarthrobacter chlorophenolicus (strain ATCC 700700 / DSM 12829 / CIP 107037 / JCM 12360 / KCTC 9906 / NCIMB 13794 / A6) TaxID=452863 RepID=B8HIK0_PSECP|nr:hypothetical protein [Pseudarthrobacter chlorophenolicus]ACL42247.1 hypothetical protein Achl_4296 [Pseudarthrobacter chlorophenolicus A6]SDQ15434.1 hypothetical protein SAMN04489738_0354 [Pseudarthrobacter chlorophenolicus]
MSSAEAPPVQLPSRLHVIGAPEPSWDVHYFTVEASLDAEVRKRLRSKQQVPSCTAVRDLFAGMAEAGTVILTCEKDHHMDVHAHRMTNPDGSVTTWRH